MNSCHLMQRRTRVEKFYGGSEFTWKTLDVKYAERSDLMRRVVWESGEGRSARIEIIFVQ